MPNRQLLRPFKTQRVCQQDPKVALFSQPANHRLLALDYDHFMRLVLAFPRQPSLCSGGGVAAGAGPIGRQSDEYCMTALHEHARCKRDSTLRPGECSRSLEICKMCGRDFGINRLSTPALNSSAAFLLHQPSTSRPHQLSAPGAPQPHPTTQGFARIAEDGNLNPLKLNELDHLTG
jgi:hypothetical protein